MAADVITDFAQGDSVFYSFGSSKMEPYVATFRDKNHFADLLHNYRLEFRIISFFMFIPGGGAQLGNTPFIPQMLIHSG
jgi:hypothetical protein